MENPQRDLTPEEKKAEARNRRNRELLDLEGERIVAGLNRLREQKNAERAKEAAQPESSEAL